jgi:hypothetical protein
MARCAGGQCVVNGDIQVESFDDSKSGRECSECSAPVNDGLAFGMVDLTVPPLDSTSAP